MELESVTFIGPTLDDLDMLDRLPSNLSGLLRQINGFIQFHGGLHVRRGLSAADVALPSGRLGRRIGDPSALPGCPP